MLRGSRKKPELHTAGLIDPEAEVQLQKPLLVRFVGRVFERLLRLVLISSLVEGERRPQYSAIGLLNPGRWSKRVREVHEHLLQAASSGTRLVGRVFEQQEGMGGRQNRLSIIFMPALLIPQRMREGGECSGPRRWFWGVETYTLYVLEDDDQHAAVSQYALFSEPKDIAWPHKPRAWLGAEWIWRRCGRIGSFNRYLAEDIPPLIAREDYWVLWLARAVGWLGSLFAMHVSTLLASFAEKAKDK